MTGMVDTAAGGRPARLLAVLAILLGLLAMHGVASAHHADAAIPVAGHGVLPAVGFSPAEAAGPDQHHGTPAAQTTTATQPDVALLAAPAGPTCHGDCPGVAALCLAVLTGAALALLLARRRARPAEVATAPPTARGPAPPVRNARGPDPVRELCVSRT